MESGWEMDGKRGESEVSRGLFQKSGLKEPEKSALNHL